MFKYSLCFATLAMLVFLFKADDEDGGDTREPNFDFDDDSVDYDYDDYDEDIGDYSDIDIDNLDYDTLLEIEKTLESLSRDGLGEGGNGASEKVSDSKSSGKGLKEEISRMRANIDGLDSNVPDNKMLSDEDREKGYKVTNMKLLKNFEAPGGLEPDEILKEAERTNDDKFLRNGKEEL